MSKANGALLKVLAEHSNRLDPEPTSLAPRLLKLNGVRVVVFDIYGTLFISDSGDISHARELDREPVILSVLEDAGLQWSHRDVSASETLIGLIRASHAKDRSNGVDYPEIEIREIWRMLLQVAGAGGHVSSETIAELAVTYETWVNPVWPMPGLQKLLHELRARQLPLGIISNAQFFTPLLFEHFLELPVAELGFDESLCVWSYRERRGKPSQQLFDICVKRLQNRGVRPEETLYVGNDMRNDIVPAAAAGMRTALFAGDARSLRLREHTLDAIPADIILTQLVQLLECVE